MKRRKEKAFAKLNLSLDILGLRPDGYHEMDMVMQSVSLCDEITLALIEGERIVLSGNRPDLPQDRGNFAVDAAWRFFQAAEVEGCGLSLDIQKKIPTQAGTAGGSSDAAAVLRGLNGLMGEPLSREVLFQIAAQVGSDVPFCLLGGTARAGGRGEILTPLMPLPSCHILLCKPDFSISTPALFRRWDENPTENQPDTQGLIKALEEGDLEGVAARLYNVFEEVLEEDHHREVRRIKNLMGEAGALGAAMSGSGPTVFGLFAGLEEGQACAARLEEDYKEVFLTRPV